MDRKVGRRRKARFRIFGAVDGFSQEPERLLQVSRFRGPKERTSERDSGKNLETRLRKRRTKKFHIPGRPFVFKKNPIRRKKSAVYSSGSIQAQKLIFKYSDLGDLTGYFSAYFDTGVGGKRESASYSRIAEQLEIAPEKILFFTDIKEEADAAKNAKFKTTLLERPGNFPQPEHSHPKIFSFEDFNP